MDGATKIVCDEKEILTEEELKLLSDARMLGKTSAVWFDEAPNITPKAIKYIGSRKALKALKKAMAESAERRFSKSIERG